MADGNGYGSGPDEQPRYGVRLPGATSSEPQGTRPNAQDQPGPTPSGTGAANGGPTGWDAPRNNGTFGPYVPDAPYGHGAYPQQGFGTPQAPGRRPKQVTAASIILWIAAAGYTILMVFSLSILLGSNIKSMMTEVIDTMPDSEASLYRDTLEDIPESSFRGLLIGVTVVVVIIGILAAVAAWRTFKGSNSWRIAGTVCGGGMALYQLLMLVVQPATGVLGLAICVVVIVLWYSKPASAYFRQTAAAKRRF
jgi:hypothetical protein